MCNNIKLPKKINEYTELELNRFRELCNFSENELKYFNMKAKDKSIVEIAMEMGVSESTVSLYSRRVRQKMFEVM